MKELYSNIVVELTRESDSARAQYPKAWAAHQSCASTRQQYRNRKQNLSVDGMALDEVDSRTLENQVVDEETDVPKTLPETEIQSHKRSSDR
jgi:hypothetical protein